MFSSCPISLRDTSFGVSDDFKNRVLLSHGLSRAAQGLLFGLFAVCVSLVVPAASAGVNEKDLSMSIVSLQIYEGGKLLRNGSGFVVQGDRFNGYIVTNAALIRNAESLTVTVPGRGGQLVAQVLRADLSSDYALLKVNGLDLPALTFSRNEPTAGEVVWSAAKVNASDKVTVVKGLLRTGYKLSDSDTGWYQHTANIASGSGAVLLNDCGQVLGLNFMSPASDGSVRTLDLSTLRRLLGDQNVKLVRASGGCVSDVVQAREKAEAASADARRAQDEAQKAQIVARKLEAQLNASQKSNTDLERQTQMASERADSAIRAAEEASARADNTRRELEEKTTVLRDETQALLKAFEEDRAQSEARFQDLLESHQASAINRERILLGLSGALMVVLGIVLFFSRYRTNSPGALAVKQEVAAPGSTHIHREELSEYVLDGRDDDGIRYLLRISGDQLVNQEGVVIGRNPKDSPYIINHADVSRKHARIKVKNNRVFIEDLGSTNGTSVNGQSIDDKGPVSVHNGDQIIIGSVVMKLRVMEG